MSRIVSEALPGSAISVSATGSNNPDMTAIRSLENKDLSDASSNTQNLCCICRKTSKSDKVLLYALPVMEKYRQLWCKQLGKDYPSGTQICGNHFRPNDFIISNKQYRLKKDAIPTQNLQGFCVLKQPVNILFLNQTSKIEHIELPSSPFDDDDIEDKIKANITQRVMNVPTKVNKTPKSSKVSKKPKSKISRTPKCKTPKISKVYYTRKSSKVCNTPPKSPQTNRAPTESAKALSTPISHKSVQTDVGYIRTCGFIEVSLEHNIFSMNCFYCEEAFPIWSWGEFVTHVNELHKREEDQLKKEFPKNNEKEKPIHRIKKGSVYGVDSELSEKNKTEETEFDSKVMDIELEDEVINITMDKFDNKQELNYIEIHNTDIRESMDMESETDITNFDVDREEENNLAEKDHSNIAENSNLSSDSDSSRDENNGSVEDDEDYLDKQEIVKALNSKKTSKRKVKNPLKVPCYLCEQFFTSEAQLKVHQKKVHDDMKQQGRQNLQQEIRQCKICNKTVKAIYFNTHMNTHKPAIYECKICGKMFQWRYTLNNHLKTHSNQRDHVCEFCGTGYLRYSDMYEHKQRAHSDERNYRCDICGYSGKTSTNLCMHRRKYHLVLEGSIEELSKKAYRSDSNNKFQVIEDPETKKQRFKCDLCENTYALLYGITRHCQRVHGVVPPRRNYERKKVCSKNKVESNEHNLVVDDCNLIPNDKDGNGDIRDMEEILISTEDLVDFNEENNC